MHNFFTLPQTLVLYLLSLIAKISTLIRLHGTPRNNFPGDISALFWLMHEYVSTISLSYILPYRVWIYHPQYNF